MRKRRIQVITRLNEEEYAQLSKLCEQTNLGKSTIIRLLIMGYTPPEAPPIEHRKIIHQLRMLGNNINQILCIARLNGILNPKELQKHLDELEIIEDEMHAAYDYEKRKTKWQ